MHFVENDLHYNLQVLYNLNLHIPTPSYYIKVGRYTKLFYNLYIIIIIQRFKR